jgi:hypothetical protein
MRPDDELDDEWAEPSPQELSNFLVGLSDEDRRALKHIAERLRRINRYH